MNKNECISVVVPFYNVELYLERCIESIINQTYKNLEIILINDGSTDKSPEIADQFAEQDARITVIHQKNTGTTVARKNGLQIASGHYLTFCDADDHYELFYIAHMHEMMVQHDVELVSTGFIDDFPEKTVDHIPTQIGIYTNDGIDEKNLLHHGFLFDRKNDKWLNSFLWNKLFIRDIFTKYYMDVPDDIYYIEDAASVYSYLPHCKSCYISNQCGYHHNLCNENSATVKIGKSEIYLFNIVKLYLYLKEKYTSLEKNYREFLMGQLQLSILKLIFHVMPKELYDTMILFPFPYEAIGDAKKVILYGAGHVCESYYKALKYEEKGVELVAILDKNKAGTSFMNTTVSSFDCLNELAYDCIVITIDNENIIEDIKEFLHTNYGVAKEKIVWRHPIYMFDLLFPY